LKRTKKFKISYATGLISTYSCMETTAGGATRSQSRICNFA